MTFKNAILRIKRNKDHFFSRKHNQILCKIRNDIIHRKDRVLFVYSEVEAYVGQLYNNGWFVFFPTFTLSKHGWRMFEYLNYITKQTSEKPVRAISDERYMRALDDFYAINNLRQMNLIDNETMITDKGKRFMIVIRYLLYGEKIYHYRGQNGRRVLLL